MDSLEESLRRIIREEVRAALDAKAAQPAPDDVLTLDAAAEAFHVSRATLRRWMRVGRLVHCGSGKLTRVRRADVVRALTASQAPAVDIHARALEIARKAG